MMKKFEYRQENVSSLRSVTKEMDTLGQEGWEAYYIHSTSYRDSVTVYMKREITE